MLPAANGAATERMPRMIGAFQGANAATTPAGWRMASDNDPGMEVGSTSPIGLVTRERRFPQHFGGQLHVEMAPGRRWHPSLRS